MTEDAVRLRQLADEAWQAVLDAKEAVRIAERRVDAAEAQWREAERAALKAEITPTGKAPK